MKRIYRIFVSGVETLVKAQSKKTIREHYKVKDVDFWCNITKKHEKLFENIKDIWFISQANCKK